jgi:hypothetical protein
LHGALVTAPGFLIDILWVEVCMVETAPADYAALTSRADYVVPAKHKPPRWVYLDGRLLVIDYGS